MEKSIKKLLTPETLLKASRHLHDSRSTSKSHLTTPHSVQESHFQTARAVPMRPPPQAFFSHEAGVSAIVVEDTCCQLLSDRCRFFEGDRLEVVQTMPEMGVAQCLSGRYPTVKALVPLRALKTVKRRTQEPILYSQAVYLTPECAPSRGQSELKMKKRAKK